MQQLVYILYILCIYIPGNSAEKGDFFEKTTLELFLPSSVKANLDVFNIPDEIGGKKAGVMSLRVGL